MTKTAKLTWTQKPSQHDYPSAASFLGLIATPTQVDVLTALLSSAATVQQHAKDILRAARLPLLPLDDPAVAKDLRRVTKGVALSPILLIQGDLSAGLPLQIADGYHRVCASYHLDEDTEIPCRIAALPAIAS